MTVQRFPAGKSLRPSKKSVRIQKSFQTKSTGLEKDSLHQEESENP